MHLCFAVYVLVWKTGPSSTDLDQRNQLQVRKPENLLICIITFSLFQAHQSQLLQYNHQYRLYLSVKQERDIKLIYSIPIYTHTFLVLKEACEACELHYSEGHSVWSCGVCLYWNPQVLLRLASVLLALFLLVLFWLAACDGSALSAAAAPAPVRAAAAAVAAHHQWGEEDYQRQREQHHQTHRVVDTLIVLGGCKSPQVIQKLSDLLLHCSAGSSRFLHGAGTHLTQTKPKYPALKTLRLRMTSPWLRLCWCHFYFFFFFFSSGKGIPNRMLLLLVQLLWWGG